MTTQDASPPEPPTWILDEETAVATVLPKLKALQLTHATKEQSLRQRVRDAHKAWTDARGDRVQREALEAALEEETRHLKAHLAARRSRDLPLGSPYFARLVLTEPKRSQELMLGKVGVVEKGLRIVDWRHAPIARLYYEYEEGEEYCEEIANREREGILSVRRRVDIRGGSLVEVERNGEVLRRSDSGSYLPPDQVEAREGRSDHRLPDIVSLITREQFGLIAQADAGVVLLRGRAGSGKTTVALHRVAWLHFQDPDRFRADRVLIVMFNKALRTYIARVLPELGVPGVGAATFHGWATQMLREGGLHPRFTGKLPRDAGQLKRHPAMEDVLAAGLHDLGARLGAWAVEKVPEAQKVWRKTVSQPGFQRLAHLLRADVLGALQAQLSRRVLDHRRDLLSILANEALLKSHLPATVHRSIPDLLQATQTCAADGTVGFEDAALLLRLGQLKAAIDPTLNVPWADRYAHIVIDEAQDLSTLEITALVHAADERRSVTIAGDPAQKILAQSGFEGFDTLLRRFGQGTAVELKSLQIGHRSTKPIMSLALRCLGVDPTKDPAASKARDGEPVVWVQPKTSDDAGWVAAVAAELAAFRASRPTALVAVLALRKNVADQWARQLKEAGLADVRRAERSNFRFTPGVIVSNVHQVKGLEFDGVVVVDPAAFAHRDRHLLHVAITRAAERLWVVAPRGPGRLLA